MKSFIQVLFVTLTVSISSCESKLGKTTKLDTILANKNGYVGKVVVVEGDVGSIKSDKQDRLKIIFSGGYNSFTMWVKDEKLKEIIRSKELGYGDYIYLKGEIKRVYRSDDLYMAVTDFDH